MIRCMHYATVNTILEVRYLEECLDIDQIPIELGKLGGNV